MTILTVIAWIAIVIGLLSSLILLVDVIRHPQMMWIMNIVWPINGWFLGPYAVWTYLNGDGLKQKILKQRTTVVSLRKCTFQQVTVHQGVHWVTRSAYQLSR